jgi:ABC-type hemin transport system substrate-binding protein
VTSGNQGGSRQAAARPAGRGHVGGARAGDRRGRGGVVSLVPSITETLLDWGVRPAAATRFCEAPGVPTVGGTKNPDVAAIVAMAPRIVLMDREENRLEDASRLEEAGMTVLATHVRSLDEVGPALELIAAAVGHGAPGPAPRPLAPVTTGRAPAQYDAPEAGGAGGRAALRVWVPIWRRPWMTVGARTYGSSLLAAAGFDNVARHLPDPYPLLEPAAARDLQPDVVLAPSEPYPFGERHRAELETVAPAVLVDGRDLFWWGSRTPAALSRLRDLARGLAGAQG